MQLSVEEMRAAVDVAHPAGRPVAVHALATQGIINAIEARADRGCPVESDGAATLGMR